jgi:biotin transport system permease protein
MLTLTLPERTILHGVPAGPKLAAACALVMLSFRTDNLGVLASGAGLLALAYAVLGGAIVRAGAAGLRGLAPFVLVVIAWHLATDDLEAGGAVVLHMALAVGIANLVTMTTQLTQMIALVERLAGPLRCLGLSPRQLGLAIALAIRFAPAFGQRLEALRLAWRARSARRPRTTILIPVLTSVFDDATRVSDALRARGGAGRP